MPEAKNSPHARRWKALTWLAVLLAVGPMLAWYLSDLWQIEHYQFFPFVGVFVAVVFYQRWDRVLEPPRGWFARSLLVLALFASLLGVLSASPWLIGLALVLALGAFFISQRDQHGLWMTYLWPVCWLALRLPMNRDERIISWLQRVTTELSSVVLSFLDVPHIARGAILDLPTRELFVAEACSGIQSFFTILFIAVAMIAWHRRPLLLLPLYILAAGMLAVLVNVIRISSIAVAEYYWRADIATGWTHDALGYTALLIAIGLLFSAHTLLSGLFAPIPENLAGDNDCRSTSVWNWLTLGPEPQPRDAAAQIAVDWTRPQVTCLAVCSVLLVLTSWRTMERPVRLPTNPNGTPPVLLEPDQMQVEAAFGDRQHGGYNVTRDREDPRLGIHSDLWNVKIGSNSAQVVISQPYNGWKELTGCYVGKGWQLHSHEIAPPPKHLADEDHESFAVSMAELRNDDRRHGLLCYCAIDQWGSRVDPERLNVTSEVLQRLRRLMSSSHSGQTVTIQCWVVTAESPNQELRHEVLELVDAVRDTMQAQLQSSRRTGG